MTHLLHIDGSSRKIGSYTRLIGCELQMLLGPDTAAIRDLAIDPVPHIASKKVEGFFSDSETHTEDFRAVTALSDGIIAEMKATALKNGRGQIQRLLGHETAA
ncbi:MAG: hypothetical protein OXR62_05945 [Ahrensia sp.]|nr:hypothetical protein [Ahrensia sp.]